MHIPTDFEESRLPVLRALIDAQPLGALVSSGPNGLEANHVPFLVDPDPVPFGTLYGHVARANPIGRPGAVSGEVLVIFQGPEHYVSPGWYPSKRETGRVVPTWNYAVVHARGVLRLIEDAGWLRHCVTRLTDRHESGRAQPWQVTDAPAEFVERMLAAIVGIEIAITALSGKWKMSQNRPRADRVGVAAGLRAEATARANAVAALIGDDDAAR
ncbi:MAG: FMN-binding negative transcriptional regulator [Gammaproteobacteria bacterium]|nr:FMN-binding negative transcriptional regulator [Gammaproteobacteria bacterium]